MKDNKGLTDLWLCRPTVLCSATLTTNPASDSSPVISPDGRTLAFVSQREGDTAPQLYLMPLAGGEPARLTTVRPEWRSRSGSRTAAASRS